MRIEELHIFLDDIRIKKGMSIAAFARKVGLPRNTVCYVLRGTRYPNFYTMSEILEKLGYEIEIIPKGGKK